MHFKVDGKELSAEGIKIGELCEAEQFLQMDMDSGTGAKIAVALYVAKKRAEPAMYPGAVAEWVRSVDMTQVDTVEDDAGPPARNGDTS